MARRHVGAAAVVLVLAAASLSITSPVAVANATSKSDVTPGECIQGQLQVAIEQGGGVAGTVPRTLGYTFLVVNTGATTCVLRGYPHEIVFSSGDRALNVAVSHQPTALYAQPEPASVVLRPGRVASFGISYGYGVAPSGGDPSSCFAQLLDVRLPARSSRLFSYEFPVRFDACAAGHRVEATPVEARVAPRP